MGYNTPVVKVELSLLPVGVKTLMSLIRPENTIAIVAEHHGCANKLMSEIIQAGVTSCRFVSGVFGDIEKLTVDRFITSEEMSDGIPPTFKSDPRMIVVPRIVSQESSIKLISTALEIESSKLGRVIKS